MKNTKDKESNKVLGTQDDRNPQGDTQRGEGQYERDEPKDSDGYNDYSGNTSNTNPDDDDSYDKTSTGNGHFADDNNRGDYEEAGARVRHGNDDREEDDEDAGLNAEEEIAEDEGWGDDDYEDKSMSTGAGRKSPASGSSTGPTSSKSKSK